MRVATAMLAMSLVIAVSRGAAPARAQTPGGDAVTEVGPARRAGAAAAALFPGVVIHGSGHFALGDRRTARRLLIAEAVGLALLGGGVALLGATGVDEQLAPVYLPMTFTGAMIVSGTFLSDLLGVAANGAGRGDGAVDPLWAPGARVTAASGFRITSQRSLGTFAAARVQASAHTARFRIAAAGEADVRGGYDAQSLELGVDVPWRPLGADRVVAGIDAHRFRLRDAGVTSMPVAVWVETTWDLRGALPRVPDAYTRWRLGVGVEAVDYAAVAGTADDLVPLLVAEAALGVRVGRAHLELGYDHRKDRLPGGVYLGRLPGMLGSFGLRARLPVAGGWSAISETRVGTGVTAWASAERAW